MAEISKTPKKGLSLPEHYDPSVDKLRENMTLIDSLLQKANPNDLSSINDGESNINTLTTTGRYLVRSNATGYPVSGYAGIVDVFRAGAYILQEWRSINSPSYEYRRYSTNSGSSWNKWIKCWNDSNDGSGSGLDADLLDNIQGSSFYRKDYNSTDFNNATLEGKYVITTDTNAPYTGCTDWVCLVYYLSGGLSEIYQIAMAESQNVPTSITGESTTAYSMEVPMVFIRKRYNSTWYSWQMLWHSGNDGSGSSLDADLLDGNHASAFAQTNITAYTDFNSVPLVVGMYGANGDATNAPVSSTGTYTVIVTKTSTGYMMLAVNTMDNNIYRRHTTGAWSASTPWVTIGGTGLQQATVTCVDSSNAESTTSYYLRVSRADTSTALKSGDVLSVTMTNSSTYSGSLCYVRYVDSTTSVSKYLYNANGSSQVPISQLPKYFLMRYDGTNFEILTPLNQTVTISTSDPTSETSGKYGDVWYTY